MLFLFRLLSKNVNSLHATIILHVDLYGYETRFQTLRIILKVSENRALRYLGQRGRKWQDAGGNRIMRSSITFTHHLLLGWPNNGG
jgi:hypothetical protein